jgi:GNAT superfamily N-acetyltransferase
VRLIGALAEYERLTHLLEVTPEKLGRHLFGARPMAEALVAQLVDGDGDGDDDAEVIGFALYFHNYSTFLARPGLYLEDLFVLPEHRAGGVGRAMLQALARIAVERECGRFEWSVLDWNEPAIRFYEAMGALVLPDWRICRVTGEALHTLARA